MSQRTTRLELLATFYLEPRLVSGCRLKVYIHALEEIGLGQNQAALSRMCEVIRMLSPHELTQEWERTSHHSHLC